MTPTWLPFYAPDVLLAYRKERTAFSVKVYGLLIFWLILALIQWMLVCLIRQARSAVKKFYYVSLVAFVLAVLLFTVYIFAYSLRIMRYLNLILSMLIVEFQIIATFLLVAYSYGADLLVFFVVTTVLMVLFILVGIILPRSVDLTLDIAMIFITASIFVIIGVFALTVLKALGIYKIYTYLVLESAVTLTILLFVMYHAQTIHGNRFVQMEDSIMASLMLFHDFLIIFWLTFYWQIHYALGSPNAFFRIPTSTPSGKGVSNDSDEPDEDDPGSDYDADFANYDQK